MTFFTKCSYLGHIKGLFKTTINYQYSCWLFLRGVAIVYAIAFLSLAVQITGLAGPNGIIPFEPMLNYAYEQDGWHAWYKIPSLFWINASDLALQTAAYFGVLLSLLLFIGRFQTFAIIGMYVLYVSLFQAGDQFLSFQWDILLLETGFLAIFLVLGGPNKLLILMFHWLLFRFRFMSGFFKIHNDDPSWLNLTTLNYYFETQVLPHFGAWYFHQLPDWLLKVGVVYIYFTELVVPFFIFLPRKFRIAAALITIFTQLLIMATSNHNFVNLLIIVLCLFLLDDEFYSKWLPQNLLNFIKSKHFPALNLMTKRLLGTFSVLILASSIATFSWRIFPVNVTFRQASVTAR
jgi:lipase maturation factor 1